MHTRAAVFTLALLAAVPAFAADVVWGTDWKTAFATAATEKKLVLVDYYATWCKPCRMMDRTTLRNSSVQQRLREFVLLRVNVDETDKDKEKKVGGFPSYIFYDSAENEWFRILGAWSVETFNEMLDAVLKARPALAEASSLLDRGRKAEAWFVAAHAYNDVRTEFNARRAFNQARLAALEEGDTSAAERAEIQAAFTWALEKDPQRSVRALEAFRTASATSENEALRWLLLGRSRELAWDAAGARTAYQRVTTIVTADHFLHKEATTALARVK